LKLGRFTHRGSRLARYPSRHGSASSTLTSDNTGHGSHADLGRITFPTLVLTAALTILLAGPTDRARADAQAYDLVIQRSPVEAGDVTPSTGAHRFSANSNVTLTANAQRGYRFAYWLGDVSDPAAQRTTILVDQPKIVIAVFHPETVRPVEDQLRPGGGGGGFDMLAPTATDLSAPGWSPASGVARRDTTIVPAIVPVVVPEPVTIALLALGTVALRRRQPRRTCQTRDSHGPDATAKPV
jgi:hypothetical protein